MYSGELLRSLVAVVDCWIQWNEWVQLPGHCALPTLTTRCCEFSEYWLLATLLLSNTTWQYCIILLCALVTIASIVVCCCVSFALLQYNWVCWSLQYNWACWSINEKLILLSRKPSIKHMCAVGRGWFVVTWPDRLQKNFGTAALFAEISLFEPEKQGVALVLQHR